MLVVDGSGGRDLALTVAGACAIDIFEGGIGVGGISTLSALRGVEEDNLARIVERSDALLAVRPVDGVDGAVIWG